MEKGAEMIIMKNFFIFFMVLLGGLFSQKFGGANDPNAFKGINLNNPYGVDIPLSTKISYKNNDNATFDDIFNKNGIPKLLIMGYYDCDMMCDAIREILFADLNSNEDVRLGIDYEIIMLSIDHDEPLSMAMKQEEIYFNRYFSDLDKSLLSHIMFAVSSKEDIESFTSEIGFEYRFNDDYEELKHRGRQKYDHPSFVYVISDQGKITSGTTSGRFHEDIIGKLKDAKNNYPSIDFDQLYAMTCLQGNIENQNPQNAFDLVKFTSTWFVLNLGFIFGYNYLSIRKRS